MSNVGSVTLLPPASTPSSTGSNPNSTLTQADFLQLMVAQFTQQDPLASDGSGDGGGASDYVNQLMSMTNLTTLQTVSGQQGTQLAQEMPGANVNVTDASGNVTTGTVQSTTIDSNGVSVVVNGVAYPSADVTAVNQSAAQVAAATAAAATTPATPSSN
jgi:flagellar hook assembly protein FlgD